MANRSTIDTIEGSAARVDIAASASFTFDFRDGLGPVAAERRENGAIVALSATIGARAVLGGDA